MKISDLLKRGLMTILSAQRPIRNGEMRIQGAYDDYIRGQDDEQAEAWKDGFNQALDNIKQLLASRPPNVKIPTLEDILEMIKQFITSGGLPGMGGPGMGYGPRIGGPGRPGYGKSTALSISWSSQMYDMYYGMKRKY